MTRQNFNRGMALLEATWPDRAPTTDTLSAYWLVLQELHDTTFEACIARCLRECTFYPRPAEILARAEELLTDGGILPKSPENAWDEIMWAISGPRRYTQDAIEDGWEYDHEFSSEAVSEACRMVGGLKRVGMTELRELPFVRKQFLEGYEGHRRRAVRYDGLMGAPLPLLGTPPVLEPRRGPVLP